MSYLFIFGRGEEDRHDGNSRNRFEEIHICCYSQITNQEWKTKQHGCQVCNQVRGGKD